MVRDLVQEMVARSQIEPLARAMYGWVAATGLHGRQMRNVLDRILRPHSNCVDVGCYPGTVLSELLRRAPQGHHFGVEPVPERFARIKARFPHVQLFNVAAGDHSGETSMPRPRSTAALDTLMHRRCGAQTPASELRVVTVCLDDLIPQDVAVRFIKIDVRGAELTAFRGSLALIRRCHPYIAFDCGLACSAELAVPPEEIYDLLTENGLAISLMEDWLCGHSPIARHTFASQINSRQNTCFLAHP